MSNTADIRKKFLFLTVNFSLSSQNYRKEFDNCIKYIMDGKGVVITGNAGYGNSGCTEAILNFCEDANIPCTDKE